MIDKEQSSYRQIMKATSLFGGVQFFNIIIQIIRSKVIAILLGPAGMGVLGLLNSTLEIINNLTNFGLQTSAVKDVSAANSSENKNRIALIIIVLQRLVWATGILGSIVTLTLSQWLSQLTFGSKEYTLAFIYLAITLLFKQLTSGQLVILQGLRKLKKLASANLLGSSLGLLITLPLYYYLGIDGIVPGIIGSAFIALFISWFFSKEIKMEKLAITPKQTWAEGKEMLKMGFMISLSGLLSSGSAYILRVFINRSGSVEDVGLYSAGFAIINSYVGLIFAAMSTDYYPRLAAVAHDNVKAKEIINQQAEIAILILAPILIMFLTFVQWIIILLYSNKFLPITGMIYWASLGMFFKAATWSVGFILLAKGATRLFFYSELASNIFILLLNILGYKFWGLNGLGLSFLISYVLIFIQVFLIAKIKYQFSFRNEFIKIFMLQLLLAILGFITVSLITKPFSYLVGIVLIVFSSIYTLFAMDKRIDIKHLLNKYLRK
jgi:O-antigen/teichoic acid export membrane protein